LGHVPRRRQAKRGWIGASEFSLSQGGNDFRVVDTQGMSVFAALQRKGVPSKFLYFPDENHWVLKPQNSKRWHEEVLAWIDRWTAR
jgi:dipeptidyl aminopeptidase/acylaminoacyl peptidase